MSGVDVKSVFKSRTMWLAFGQFIVGVATALGVSDPNMQLIGVVAAGKALVDAYLRFTTTKAVQ